MVRHVRVLASWALGVSVTTLIPFLVEKGVEPKGHAVLFLLYGVVGTAALILVVAALVEHRQKVASRGTKGYIEFGDVRSRAVRLDGTHATPWQVTASRQKFDEAFADWLGDERERGRALRDQINPPRGYIAAPGAGMDFTVLTARIERKLRGWARAIRGRLSEEAPRFVATFDAGPDLPAPHIAAGVIGTATREQMRAFVEAKLAALDHILERGQPGTTPSRRPRDPVEALRAERRAAERIREWLAFLDSPDGKLSLDEDRVYAWAERVFHLLRLSFVEHADTFMGTTLTELGHRYFATAYYEQVQAAGRQRYLQDRVALVDEILRSQ